MPRRYKRVTRMLNSRGGKTEVNKFWYILTNIMAHVKPLFQPLQVPVNYMAGVALLALDILLIVLFTIIAMSASFIASFFRSIFKMGESGPPAHPDRPTPTQYPRPVKHVRMNLESMPRYGARGASVMERISELLPGLLQSIMKLLSNFNQLVQNHIQRGLQQSHHTSAGPSSERQGELNTSGEGAGNSEEDEGNS